MPSRHPARVDARASFEIWRILLILLVCFNAVQAYRYLADPLTPEGRAWAMLLLIPINLVTTAVYIWIGVKGNNASAALAKELSAEEGERTKLWGLLMLLLSLGMATVNWLLLLH
jgi:hypothetical protein